MCIKSEDLSTCGSRYVRNVANDEFLAEVINRMGENSALAQNLPQVVTSFQKFKNSSHRLYILSSSVANQVLGILKIGEKRLFLHDNQGVCTELEPLCILDFYIHESMQRMGYGRKLFDHMLEVEKVIPCSLAIDSPSKKMLQFLKKHYRLDKPIFASNNFVIYPGFFSATTAKVHSVYQDFRPVHSSRCSRTTEVGNVPQLRPLLSRNSIDQPSFLKSVPVKQMQPGYIPNYSLPHTRVEAMPTRVTAIANTQTEPGRIESRNSTFSRAQLGSFGRNVNILPDQTNKKLTHWDTNKLDHRDVSVLSKQELQVLRGLPSNSRLSGAYTYLKAVQNHNGHRKLW
ncbi:hypothetical protein EG68_02257 [Paragonimus skrjabini miyazakii]|uniref:Alpha-tubulin N-acetyltransferase n=1 Tax=Paragonimus skrjabini miyazakii TaxID=59628 RepID=A0A8S9ZAU3_9TREM|nr:hypothetical protein EG68_02257 [Paragonimus skrjabini miyazakii]